MICPPLGWPLSDINDDVIQRIGAHSYWISDDVPHKSAGTKLTKTSIYYYLWKLKDNLLGWKISNPI